MQRQLLFIGLCVAMFGQISAVSHAFESENSHGESKPVSYTRGRMDEYLNFIKNWDHDNYPVLYALVQTPAQYDALFHPAPVMGAQGDFAPDQDIYKHEQLIIVARVIPASENMEKVFKVEQITATNQALTLAYQFTPPESEASFSVKSWMVLRVPQHDYRTLTFVENNVEIGRLNFAEGQWCVPNLDDGQPSVESEDDTVVGASEQSF